MDHHAGVVAIPLAFSVFVRIVATEDVLLDLGVLESWFGEDILEVLSALIKIVLVLDSRAATST